VIIHTKPFSHTRYFCHAKIVPRCGNFDKSLKAAELISDRSHPNPRRFPKIWKFHPKIWKFPS